MLEFEEFLKIEGCQTGRHCFTPVVTESKVGLVSQSLHAWIFIGMKTEEKVDCRIDHYQTPDQVHVSVFAKQVDKERSTVKFEADKVSLTVFLIELLTTLNRFSSTSLCQISSVSAAL